MATIIPSVLLAAPLGTDSSALCASIGAREKLPMRRRLAITGTLTAFEAGMPVIGILLAGLVGPWLGTAAHWIGAALLVLLGLWMLRDSDNEGDATPLGFGALLAAGLAVSIDEIAVGMSLGLNGINVPVLVTTIALIVGCATWAGLTLGQVLHNHAETTGKIAAWALVGLGILLGLGIL